MEIVCLLLTVFGLIICFGGIYIRKFCSFIMGLVWGAFLSTIIVVLATESMRHIDNEKAFAGIAIGAILIAIFSAIYEKVCAFLNSFIPTFFIVCVLLLFNSLLNKDLEESAVIIIALVAAFITGCISCLIHNIAFMLETAFAGAYIAILGVHGLVKGARDFGDVVFGAVMDDEATAYILLGTFVLGIIGFCVQLNRFYNIKKEKSTSPKNGTCILEGQQYKCGEQQGHPNTASKEWNCKCGAINTDEMLFCPECGEGRLRQECPIWICPTCGTENEYDMLYCPECGEAFEGEKAAITDMQKSQTNCISE